MDKYNYVILGSDWDLYKFSYSDLYQFNNVQYIPGPYPPINSLKGLLYRIHFNPTINRLVKLPFKTAWNDSYFKHRFPVSKPFHRIYELDQTGRRYYNILKRKISQCKTRMHFTRSGKHSSILLQQFKEAIRLGSVLRSRRLCNIRIHLSPIGVLILSRKNKKNAL